MSYTQVQGISMYSLVHASGEMVGGAFFSRSTECVRGLLCHTFLGKGKTLQDYAPQTSTSPATKITFIRPTNSKLRVLVPIPWRQYFHIRSPYLHSHLFNRFVCPFPAPPPLPTCTSPLTMHYSSSPQNKIFTCAFMLPPHIPNEIK